MYINLSSSRECHPFEFYVDGISIKKVMVKTINSSSNKEILVLSYYIEKTGTFKITVIERLNSRILRFIWNLFWILFVLVGAIFAGFIDFSAVFSIRYTKGKLELEVESSDMQDVMKIHQVMKNPPFEIELKSELNSEYKILFNGRFKGKSKKQI